MTEGGVLIGVGVGPGDPELLTLKAFRAIRDADVVACIGNEKGESQARTIAQLALAERTQGSENDRLVVMPMLEDRAKANAVYDQAASDFKALLSKGQSIAFLCEGDPLFFGSFAYLLERIEAEHTCEVIPGISSVNAAASVLQHPLTMLSESFAVVSGRHNVDRLTETLQRHDSVVIMKAGRARPVILEALDAAGRSDDAQYMEYIGREQQQIVRDVSTLDVQPGPYFSLFVVTRSRQHRQAKQTAGARSR